MVSFCVPSRPSHPSIQCWERGGPVTPQNENPRNCSCVLLSSGLSVARPELANINWGGWGRSSWKSDLVHVVVVIIHLVVQSSFHQPLRSCSIVIMVGLLCASDLVHTACVFQPEAFVHTRNFRAAFSHSNACQSRRASIGEACQPRSVQEVVQRRGTFGHVLVRRSWFGAVQGCRGFMLGQVDH